MKKTLWIKSLLLLGLCAPHSRGFVGFGVHWAPAPGLEVKSDKGIVAQGLTRSVSLDEMGVSGGNGLGAKLWIDILPLVDLEFTGDIQFGYYDVNVVTPGDTTPVKFDLNVPFLEGKPFYARAIGDVAILYPFLKLPPLVNLLKVYAGAGLTYGASTPVLSAAFAKDALDKAQAAGDFNPDTGNPTPILVEAIKDADFEKGLGWFLQLGAHAKPPVIPIAAYLDFKYRFPGINPDLVEGNGLTVELGGALAF